MIFEEHDVDQGEGFICCTVGSRQFAFRAADIRHAARADKLRVGADDDGRLGVLKINGQSIPVFDLGRTLGESSSSSAARDVEQHIAVTGRPGEMVGWLVDRIARAVMAEGTTVMPLPSIIGVPATTWFDALLRLGDNSVLLLAPRRLHPPVAPVGRAPASCDVTAVRSLRTQPMALLFSTPALPHCDVARFAISARQIVGIVKALTIVKVPGSASHVAGVSWWRNTVVPVIDFRNHDAVAVHRERFLVAQCGGEHRDAMVAFPIDSDIAMHKPADSDLGLAATALPPFVDGAFQVGGETAALLNLNTLLTINQGA